MKGGRLVKFKQPQSTSAGPSGTACFLGDWMKILDATCTSATHHQRKQKARQRKPENKTQGATTCVGTNATEGRAPKILQGRRPLGGNNLEQKANSARISIIDSIIVHSWLMKLLSNWDSSETELTRGYLGIIWRRPSCNRLDFSREALPHSPTHYPDLARMAVSLPAFLVSVHFIFRPILCRASSFCFAFCSSCCALSSAARIFSALARRRFSPSHSWQGLNLV